MRYPRAVLPVATLGIVAISAILFRSHESVRAADVTTAQADLEKDFHSKIVPFLVQNCYECHGNGNHKGNLALDSFKSPADVQADHKQWEKVLKDLRGGYMPAPSAKTFPSFQERNAVADWVQNELLIYAVAHPDPGVAVIHRLTRAEYINTVRDLVGIDFKPADDFPADGPANGAVPVGGVQPITPELKDKYLAAASQIMDQAIVANSDKSQPMRVMPAALAADFSVKPTGDTKIAAAREILGNFARHAWRRPVEAAELDSLINLFTTADKNGESFEEAIKLPMKTVLVSPDFLFCGVIQSDAGDSKSALPVNEYELASRLSYFIWSSMPDAKLFNLAEHNQLRTQLAAQVKRMIASPKAEALVENFSAQWLQYLNLAKPDNKQFPEFDADLRESMRKETQLFFNAVMREDRSVVDFLNGDFTFVNQRLAELYGIQGVKGDQFRRVSLDGTPRRGVLTQAGVLTSTIYGPRVSIAKRGRWVMMNFLNLPGSTPLVGAPPLPEVDHPGSGPIRKQLEQHRANQACEYCHVQIDPLGFALENFDAIGKWRDMEGSVAVDASGQLPTGEDFNGSVQMINILAEQHRDQFLDCIATKMLGYALGRAVVPSDQPAVDQIVVEMQKNDLKFSSLVMGIVNSMPFQMCPGESTAAAAVP